MFRAKRSVSALIATILLIVVAVALVAIILSWSKTFTNTNLDTTTHLLNASPSDAQYYLTIDDGINGRFLVNYDPPSSYDHQNISITRYRLLDYNNIIDFETPVDINANQTESLDMGIITSPFDIVLYLDDDTIITKQGIKNTNRAPTNCPTGYVPVPGNYLYNTVNGEDGGFCVAKYEMKVDETGDGIGDVNTFCQNSSYATWNNGATACGYNAGTRHLVTSAAGYPLATISQTDSITACSSLGANYHLITNDERMTIARNIEQVTSNWSGGAVGSGSIPRGNSNTSAAMDGTTDLTGINKRTLTLTNGQVVWDLAGNVWEWTSYTINAQNEPHDATLPSASGEWIEYSAITDLGTMKYKDLFLLTNNDYNSDNGVGRVYTDAGDTGARALLFGGNCFNGTHAGLMALYLNYEPGTTNLSIGLRCVVVP